MIELSLDFEIGIVEYRNIIKVIKDTYGYDFSDYALTSLKRRFERYMQLQRFRKIITISIPYNLDYFPIFNNSYLKFQRKFNHI